MLLLNLFALILVKLFLKNLERDNEYMIIQDRFLSTQRLYFANCVMSGKSHLGSSYYEIRVQAVRIYSISMNTSILCPFEGYTARDNFDLDGFLKHG